MTADARSKTLKVLKIVLWSILGLILLFVLVVVGTLLVKKYIKKSPVPTFAGYGYCVVITGSMSGTIEKGDMVIIKKTDDYKITDIVTYVSASGEVITHRIVNYGVEDGTFITKGDANPTTDGKAISYNQIIGEVVHTIPKIGLVFEWVLHDGGIIYLIALLVVIVAGAFFLNMIKSSDGDKEKEAVAESSEENLESVTEVTAENSDESQNNAEVIDKEQSQNDKQS